MKRLEVYHEQTRPLIEYYTQQGVYFAIKGYQPIDKVFSDINSSIKGMNHDNN